jgi:hypothetical protein
VCSLIVNGPVLSDHVMPNVVNFRIGMIRAHKHPTGYTRSRITTVGIDMAGLRMLRNMLIPDSMVTKKNPKIQARKVFATSSPSFARTAARTLDFRLSVAKLTSHRRTSLKTPRTYCSGS